MRTSKWARILQVIKQKKYSFMIRVALYIFLSVVAFVFVYPFLYMLFTSVKSLKDLNDISVDWIPREFYFYNYVRAFDLLNYFQHFGISTFLTVVSIGIKSICCSFIAYGLSRYNFPGKNFWFGIVILSIIVPTQTIILPQYLEFAAIKWTGSYLPILIPQLFGFGLKGGLFIFIYRQFFMNLPKTLEEAARLDGCGAVSTYWKIALPATGTSTLVTAVLAMVWHWNDYYEPAIYLQSEKLWPLPAMLPKIYAMYQTYFSGNFNLGSIQPSLLEKQIVTEGTVMAATVLVILPIIIAYAFLQKRFIQGIERSGLVE